MIRQIVSGFLHGHDPIIAERWYYRYHCKEVVRPLARGCADTRPTRPCPRPRRPNAWRTRRLPDRALVCQPGRLRGSRTLRQKMDPDAPLPAGTAEVEPCHILVPARPTEDFLGREPAPEEGTVMRWFCVFRYPQGSPSKRGTVVPGHACSGSEGATRPAQVRESPGLGQPPVFRCVASNVRAVVREHGCLAQGGCRFPAPLYAAALGRRVPLCAFGKCLRQEQAGRRLPEGRPHHSLRNTLRMEYCRFFSPRSILFPASWGCQTPPSRVATPRLGVMPGKRQPPVPRRACRWS